jgi:hypothetical protein
MEIIISKYRGELKSIIRPAFIISYWTGLIFFAVIFLKDNFIFDMKMLKATIVLESILILFIAIFIRSCTLVYKITVFRDEISSYDPWGSLKCYFMKYSDMTHIKIKSVFGYKYYFISSENNSKTLWIPFNVNNKDRFKETYSQ